MILRLSLPLVVALLCGSSSSRAQAPCERRGETLRVMVHDLELAPGYAAQAGAFLQVLAEEAGRVDGFEVLSADDVRAALDQEAEKAFLGCEANSCLAEIAAALDASYVVSGGVSSSGEGGTFVRLSLLDTREVVVVNRVTMAWRGDDTELASVVRAAAQTLLLAPHQRPPGGLRLVGLPAGARVFVDDVEAVASSAEPLIEGLQVGPHEVQLQAPGRVPLSLPVVIAAGEVRTLTPQLEEANLRAGWIAAAVATAIVIGGGAALGLAYWLQPATVDLTTRLPKGRAIDNLSPLLPFPRGTP